MKKRILFFAEGVSLSHLARCLGIISRLEEGSKDKYELIVATPYWNWPSMPIYHRRVHLDSIKPKEFNKRLAWGEPLYTEDELEKYISNDLLLFDQIRPDIVVGDFRLSLAISARIAEIPLITVSNIYWSGYSLDRVELPVIFPWTYIFPIGMVEEFFQKHRTSFMMRHADVYNRVRSKHGIDWRYSLREIYGDGDYQCFADIPELFKYHSLPDKARFIGPVLWEPHIYNLPKWWTDQEFFSWEKPIGYVTIGSTGRRSPLKKVVNALKQQHRFYLASSKHDISHQYASDYLPGIKACTYADYVICNGGSMSTQQALLAGKPVIGIVHNMDQAINMAAIANAGLGILLRADRLSKRKIQEAVEAVTINHHYRERCENLYRNFHHTDSFHQFELLIDSIGSK